MRWTIAPFTFAIVGLAASAVHAQVSSGPKARTQAAGFSASFVTGDQEGKSVDIVAQRGGKATVYAFVRADAWSRPMARFLKTLDQEFVKGLDGVSEPATVAVWLTEDKQKSKDYLPLAQQSLAFDRTSLGVFEGEPAGPAGWEVNVAAHLTVVVVKDGKVVASFGFVSLNETDVPDIVKVLRKP